MLSKSNRRGSARLKKKIKDKKQTKLPTWGLAAALNPEKRRDVVIQAYLPSGEVTGFWGSLSVGSRGPGWGVPACRGLPQGPQTVAGTRKAHSSAGVWAEKCWRRNHKNRPVY